MKANDVYRISNIAMQDADFITVFLGKMIKRTKKNELKKSRCVKGTALTFSDQDSDAFVKNETIILFSYNTFKISRIIKRLFK